MESSEFLEQQRLAKQQFLVDEIIEKGYDPSDFVAFCDTKRGSNIDLWELEELKQLVREFTQIIDQALEDDERENNALKTDSSPAELDSSSDDGSGRLGATSGLQIEGDSALEHFEVTRMGPAVEVAIYQANDEKSIDEAYPISSDNSESAAQSPEVVEAFNSNDPYVTEPEVQAVLPLPTRSYETRDQEEVKSEPSILRASSYEARLEEELKSNPLSYSISSPSLCLSPLSICPPPIISVKE